MLSIQDVLGPDGLMAKALPGFSYRAQQAEMAEQVTDTIERGELLVAEAGTGTGKTFSYLVPALLSGSKVIISTGTKNLQDQLFLRDLPKVQDVLASPVKTALLKGRSNYLCIHRMESALHDGRGHQRTISRQLAQIRDWSVTTRSGDIAELKNIPEDTMVWPLVTSTGDNCLGSECPDWSKCHLVEARRNAQEADMVIINHHLLCADFAIKDEGFGELLPAADAFIIDEAHQLPDVASSFFGSTISTRQIVELSRDTELEYHKEAGDMPELVEQTDKLAKAARDLRLAFGQRSRRGGWQEIVDDADIKQALGGFRGELSGLFMLLDTMEGRGKGLDSCLARTQELGGLLDQMCATTEDSQNIRWFETHTQSLRMNSTPLDIAELFQAQVKQHPASWVFTSATLAVGDSFEHFQQQLGLEQAHTAKWDSPFDYQKQALWFVPKGLPPPSDAQYTHQVMELALPILKASKGRAFLLFTSYRALNEAADWLENKLDYPLLVQGDAPKAELIHQFVEHGNAILLGTSSFWEGVDVRGNALSLVLIDKLPFASPGDPVLQARLDVIKKQGGNPFMQYQVPQTAIALKQGAGRLIRDVTDRGVLVLCDPRMLKKSYGYTFLEAMPPFARTRELQDVIDFFQANPVPET
jgi:ATP-dependent DNA helicase DinG